MGPIQPNKHVENQPEPAKEIKLADILETLADDLKKEIFSQDEAIDALDDALVVSFAGLREEDKPIAKLLFKGPTGSGKTELARQLAKKLDIQPLILDMAEYSHGHEVAKLVGSPPGYLGHGDTPAILTKYMDDTKNQPYRLIVLDEIEKAHEDVFKLFLGVLDRATMTDGKNRTLDFRNTIIIMTSNVGEKERKRGGIGILHEMSTAEDKRKDWQNQIMIQLFSPEFLNRLDGIVTFKPLDEKTMFRIAGKKLTELESRLSKKNVGLVVTEAGQHYVAERGYDPQYGARPLGRLVDKEIATPAAREIVYGKLKKGGILVVDSDGEMGNRRLMLKFKKAAAPANDNQDSPAVAETKSQAIAAGQKPPQP